MLIAVRFATLYVQYLICFFITLMMIRGSGGVSSFLYQHPIVWSQMKMYQANTFSGTNLDVGSVLAKLDPS